MTDFQYIAQGSSGRQFTGVIEAENRAQAAAQLRAQKLLILNLEERTDAAMPQVSAGQVRMVPAFIPVFTKDLISILRQLRVMLHSGISLHNALRNLERECVKPRLKKILQNVSEQIQRGIPFSVAVSQQKYFLSPSAVGILASAEQSGEMAPALNRIVSMMEFRKKLIGQAVMALIYPSIVFFFAVLVTAYLVFVFVPDLNDKLLSKMGKPLPALTQWLVDFANSFRDQWILISLGLMGLIIGLLLMFRNAGGRRLQERSILYLPLFGRAMKYAMVSQFSGTMAVMQRSGVSMLNAIDAVATITPVLIYQDLFASASAKLLRGVGLRDAIDSPLFPSTVFSVVAAGEASGALSESFEELERFYSDELESLLSVIMSLFSPAILLSVAVVVGVVYVAMFMALISFI